MAKKIKVVESFPKPEDPSVPLRLYIKGSDINVEDQEGHSQTLASLETDGTLKFYRIYSPIADFLNLDRCGKIIVS